MSQLKCLASLPKDVVVCLWVRESRDNGNLVGQIKAIKEAVKPRIVKRLFKIRGRANNPKTLIKRSKAFDYCRKYNLPLVVDELSRLTRSPEKFKDFIKLTKGVRIYAVDPTLDPSEQSSHRIKRGFENRIRPYRKTGSLKKRKENSINTILKMHRKGNSLREIEKVVKIPYRTIGRWINQESTISGKNEEMSEPTIETLEAQTLERIQRRRRRRHRW